MLDKSPEMLDLLLRVQQRLIDRDIFLCWAIEDCAINDYARSELANHVLSGIHPCITVEEWIERQGVLDNATTDHRLSMAYLIRRAWIDKLIWEQEQ